MCGRAKASQAFVQLQRAVTERLQQEAAALEIQRCWHMWRKHGDAADSAPHTSTERSVGGTRNDSTVRNHALVGGSRPHAASGSVEQSLHCSHDDAGGPAAFSGDGCRDTTRGGDWCENRSAALSDDDKSQQPREQQLPEAALVCARVLQLRKMGIQLLWLQPEPEPEPYPWQAGQHACTVKQLRSCRVAGTVATAEYFFTRG